MTNIGLAERVVQCLLSSGVTEFCLCAGARNSPLISLFDANPHLKTYHFFEERSASFFALGRMAVTRKPVAVITTSGTAAAECLAAAVEGTYSSLPLIIVTADRPKTYRGTGAPQTINQIGLYSYYIEATFDLDEVNSHVSLNGLSWKKPVHINVCFKEPLIDAPIRTLEAPKKPLRTRFPEAVPMDMVEKLEDFLTQYKPLIVVSTIPEKSKKPVLDFLSRVQAPIYVEGISGLRGQEELSPLYIRAGEKMLTKMIDHGTCNALFRLGGVPTTRFWRDLEDKYAELPVFSIGYNHFTGLSREVPHYDDLDDLARLQELPIKEYGSHWRQVDKAQCQKLHEIFDKYPRSEPSLLRALSKHIVQQNVFIGNSLPVREWDLVTSFDEAPMRISASRGANGIDGQVSTYMGWSDNRAANWCVVGDLTAMYDLSALWITPQLEANEQRIVVMNNKGGMIFDRMFGGKDIFLNRHRIEFEAWAAMWKWGYSKWEIIPDKPELQTKHIIEVQTDEEQTRAFWRAYDDLWK